MHRKGNKKKEREELEVPEHALSLGPSKQFFGLLAPSLILFYQWAYGTEEDTAKQSKMVVYEAVG